jgi:hypothetical protein
MIQSRTYAGVGVASACRYDYDEAASWLLAMAPIWILLTSSTQSASMLDGEDSSRGHGKTRRSGSALLAGGRTPHAGATLCRGRTRLRERTMRLGMSLGSWDLGRRPTHVRARRRECLFDA